LLQVTRHSSIFLKGIKAIIDTDQEICWARDFNEICNFTQTSIKCGRMHRGQQGEEILREGKVSEHFNEEDADRKVLDVSV